MRALAELKAMEPGQDWDQASSQSDLSLVVNQGKEDCGRSGARRFCRDLTNYFQPQFCKDCPQCLHEERLEVLLNFVTVSKALASDAVVYVQVYDLSDCVDPMPSKNGASYCVLGPRGEVLQSFSPRFGFRLRDSKPVNKIKDKESARIGYQNKSKARQIGGCSLLMATVRNLVFEPGDQRRESFDAENFGVGPFLVVFSEAQTRLQKPGEASSRSLEPKVLFHLSPMGLIAYTSALFDVGRERVFNAQAASVLSGKRCRIGWYGRWSPEKEPKPSRLGSIKINGVHVGEWPWFGLKDRYANSDFRRSLEVLYSQAVAGGLGVGEAEALRDIKTCWAWAFLLREAIRLLTEEADRLSNKAAPASPRIEKRRQKKALRFRREAEKAEDAFYELDRFKLRPLLAQVPSVSHWSDVLRPVL